MDLSHVLSAIMSLVVVLVSIYPGFLEGAACQALLSLLFTISIEGPLAALWGFACAARGRGILPDWRRALTNKFDPTSVGRGAEIGDVGGELPHWPTR